jgi:hypothetical protein
MAEELPKPGSEELQQLIPRELHQRIYEVLYDRREDPPTMHEIQAALPDDDAHAPQFNRRVRELRDAFILEGGRDEHGNYIYRLSGVRSQQKAEAAISKTTRAYVLRHQRCEMCGKTPKDDGVRLHVDHKIPREWGGTNDVENLQALCSECNEGKRDRFSSFDVHGSHIARAVSYDEPHMRIGELLKEFAPEEVPSELLDLVASAKQYQDDWQKRLRELRVLGWIITPRKEKEDGRVKTYWRLGHSEPWPEGSISAEIRRREKAQKGGGS